MKPPVAPPHDLGAEHAVLSTILLEPHAVDVVSAIVKPEDMYSPASQWVMKGAVALRARGEPIDAVTVAGWLKSTGRLAEIGGIPFLTRLVDCTPSVANVEAHARIVWRKARRRRVISTAQRIVAEGYTDDAEDDEYVERSAQALASVAAGPASADIVDFGAAVYEFFDDVSRAAQSSGVVGMSTGYASIDRQTSGLHRREVTIIAGRPGSGKTALLLDTCIEAAQSRGEVITASFIVSAEMPPKTLAARGFCARAGVPLSNARSGTLSDWDWKKLSETAQWSQGFPIRLMGRLGSITALRTALREYQAHLARNPAPDGREIKLGIVAVDYVQLVAQNSTTRAGNQTQEEQISNLVMALQELAKEFDVAMILLSQLNREVEKRPDKRPMISDLKGSGAVEAVADLIMLLYRDEYYNPNTRAKGIAEIIIGKQRSGATGKILMGFDARLTTFRELSDEQRREFSYLVDGEAA